MQNPNHQPVHPSPLHTGRGWGWVRGGFFSHSLKISLRNLLKYKLQNAISILALAVGIVTLAAMHFVLKHFGPPAITEEPYYERTYVAELSNGQNNYGITMEDGTQEWMFVYTRITTEMDDALFSGGPLPGVEKVTHNASLGGITMGGSMTFTLPDGSERMGSYHYYVTQAEDLNFWGIRSALTGEKIPVLGNKEIVIGEMHAREIFGNENPVGCSVLMNHNGEWKTFTIRDVYTSERIADRVDGMYTYVEGAKDYYHFNYAFVLEEGVNPKDVEAEMTRRMKTLDPQFSARLTPLSEKIDEKTGHMSVTRTIVYLISSLILAAALIGFLKMQLQLFRMRQREVALRRVHGAKSGSIFRLFACETLFTFMFTGIVAFVLATLLIDFANASLTTYLNQLGWHIEGVYETVAVILLVVVLISFFVVWLTVRTMMRQRQSMTMQLQRSRGHALRNTMLGIQIAICILFVGGSLALTHFSELALREMNVPENDDFYKECIIVRPYKSYLESPKLLEYLRTEAQDVERFIPMNLELLESKEIQEDSVAYEEQGNVFIRECMVNDTAIFDFWNRSINWILPPEERHDCILMNDSLYVMMERYGFNNNGWFLPIDRQPLRIGGTFSAWPYTVRITQRYQVVHLGNWRDEEVTEVIVQPKKGAYNRVFADLTEALQRINPKPLEQRVTNLRDALDDEIFFIEIMRDASWILSSICLVICLMGIWSTIALDTRSRQKEVALRKIHGAKRKDIALLFGRLYLWLIGIAAIVSTPLIILFNTLLKDWARNGFINGMAERLSPTLPILGALLLTALVILLIVGYHLHQVIKQHPADIIAKE